MHENASERDEKGSIKSFFVQVLFLLTDSSLVFVTFVFE
jgi:hypothetical protein